MSSDAASTSEPPSSSDRPSIEDVLSLQRDVIARLFRSSALIDGDVETALRLATEAASQLLAVRRASVWRFDEERRSIHCLALYDAATGTHASKMVLHAEDAPSYFAAALQERCIVAHDARNDPRTREFRDGYLVPHGITAMLDAPVLVRGELVGVVCHEHVGGARRWHAREELLAGTLADFVGMAWSAAEHLIQARELGVLRDGLERLVDERTRALHESRENVRALFEASPVAMVLARQDDHRVLLANHRASELFDVAPESTRGKHAPDFWVDGQARLTLLDAVRQRGVVVGFESELQRRDGGRFWGSLSARALTFESQSALLVCVEDISERKELEARLRQLAVTDELTGIANRRHFFEQAEPLVALAERHGRAVSAAMLDVDHFKRINDEHGHTAGDEALRLLAGICRDALRLSDLLARYGGEEFVILFPETAAETALAAIERIQRSLGSSIPRFPALASLTISAGIAERQRGESLAALLKRADDALYRAKRDGRDRAVLDVPAA